MPESKNGRRHRIIAVSAWRTPTERDLRLIGTAMELSLDWALKHKFDHVRMTLLAAGNSRHFHARFSLIEMIRGYARWTRKQGTTKGLGNIGAVPLRLTIHLIDQSAVFELESGRLDIPELLSSDDIRFWIEVARPDQRIDRQVVIRAGSVRAGEIAQELGIDGKWRVIVFPTPSLAADEQYLSDVYGWELTRLGVMPGSTLRFSQSIDDQVHPATSAENPESAVASAS